jgi:hypothetical protein
MLLTICVYADYTHTCTCNVSMGNQRLSNHAQSLCPCEGQVDMIEHALDEAGRCLDV